MTPKRAGIFRYRKALKSDFSEHKKLLTPDLLQNLLHAAAVVSPLLLLTVQRRTRVNSSSGDVRAAGPAAVAAQAAATAAAGGRGHRPPPGARRRPVRFHDLILGFEDWVVPAPCLSGRRRRGARRDPAEPRLLMLDVLHLYALA